MVAIPPERSVAVDEVLRDRLIDVPMFDRLTVFESEDIDVGAAPITGFADDVNLEDDEIAVCKNPLDFAMAPGETFAHRLDEPPQSFNVVLSISPVLNIFRPEIARRRDKVPSVHDVLIEVENHSFVGFVLVLKRLSLTFYIFTNLTPCSAVF